MNDNDESMSVLMQELQYYTFEALTIDTGKKDKKLRNTEPLKKIQWETI